MRPNKRERNDTIVSKLKFGVSAADVAAEFGLTVNGVYSVVRRHSGLRKGLRRWRARQTAKIANGEESCLVADSKWRKQQERLSLVAELRSRGCSEREIAEQLGVSIGSAAGLIKRTGVKIGKRQKKPKSHPDVERVARKIKEGKTVDQVAKEIGKSIGTVHYIATKDPELAMGIVAYKRKKRAEKCHG